MRRNNSLKKVTLCDNLNCVKQKGKREKKKRETAICSIVHEKHKTLDLESMYLRNYWHGALQNKRLSKQDLGKFLRGIGG